MTEEKREKRPHWRPWIGSWLRVPRRPFSRRAGVAARPLRPSRRPFKLALRTVEELRRCDAISPALVAAPASSPVAEPQAVDEAAENVFPDSGTGR